MKIFQKTFLVASLSGLIFNACSNSEPKAVESTKDENVGHSESNFVNEVGVLQLNNGEKWNVNQATALGVESMILQVEAFKEIPKPYKVKDLNTFGNGINYMVQSVFDQCTMQGAAHDELHDFLNPILHYSKNLQSDQLDTANQAFLNLDKHLKIYKHYFE